MSAGGYNIGVKTILRFLQESDALEFHKAKLTPALFKGEDETTLFTFAQEHLHKYHKLPQPETMLAKFPMLAEYTAPEPINYYLDLLLNRFEYDTINSANLASQTQLMQDKTATAKALAILDTAKQSIIEQRFRQEILDFGKEGATLLKRQYWGTAGKKLPITGFGWPYLDGDVGGRLMPGDIISIVGRPSMGKTWFVLYCALYNWHVLKRNVLFVSMEMNTLAIAQRAGAMYAAVPVKQLMEGSMATGTYTIFDKGIQGLLTEESKFYVVNGRMAATPVDIYTLAVQLDCDVVCVDGAYLVKSKNPRLNRYERVAENVEDMKIRGEDCGMVTVASWQFAKTAVKNKEAKKKGEKPGLEDIGYSDAIAQTSSMVLGLMQEEGIETMNTRIIDLLKGRSGETGKFAVNWLFNIMDFRQVMAEPKELEWL